MPTTVVLPLYRQVRATAPSLERAGPPFTVTFGDRSETAWLYREQVGAAQGPQVFFIEHPDFFDRAGIYGDDSGDYPDNALRFAFFCAAALTVLPQIAPEARVLHAHDWHTGLAPVYLLTVFGGEPLHRRLGSVLSVHNAGFQGHFPSETLAALGLPGDLYKPGVVERYGRMNILKGGLTFADLAVTVSPTHARELLTPEGGFGLQEKFIELGDRVVGILNGIDALAWNPGTDPHITANYSIDDLAGKRRCKAALQQAYGLSQGAHTPLFGMSARLVSQKGLDIVLGANLLGTSDAQFIFLGSGEHRYHAALTELAAANPERVAVEFAFTDHLEHGLLAGADLLLMPSLYAPYVLHHGRWPHGSDWLCEAALDTYLPLVEQLQQLAEQDVPSPVTIGFTPVLANQLASAAFAQELEAFFDQREAACQEAPASLAATGDTALLPLVSYWQARFRRLRDLFHSLDHDLVTAFRRFQDAGRLEIIGSAATHGYLPLLACDESIRLQLAWGRSEHRRLFGRDPVGCWLPECAYRPRQGRRPGIEEELAAAGFRYFFTDAHLAQAGDPLGSYGEVPLGAERFDAERPEGEAKPAKRTVRSPYQAYRVTPPRGKQSVAALVRDPRSSMQVWSRHHGYPGDEWYLEFHKIRWPGGLKLWRVTGPDLDLGAKRAYEPAAALGRVGEHGRHFAHLLAGIAAEQGGRGAGTGVIVAPFGTELFGHWWFGGVDLLAATYRELRHHPGVRPVTASQHLASHPAGVALRLAEGSWGVNGDHTMWLNDRTAWTWPRLHALEGAFWKAAPAALAAAGARPALAQAARELLLAQASDWQFMISTGAVPDYAERRFKLHCDDAERLVAALTSASSDGVRLAAELEQRDALFPKVLEAVAEVLGA